MREIRQSGSEGGGTKPIVSPYPYFIVKRFGRMIFYVKQRRRSVDKRITLEFESKTRSAPPVGGC